MDKSPSLPATAIVIAAGGRGSRIGANKPERALNGVTLLDRTVLKAEAWGGPVAIAIADDRQIASRNLVLLVDEQRDLGPVSALKSAFEFAASRDCTHVLLIGCDMPFLPDNLVKRLSDSIGDAGAAIPVSNSRPQFMAGLWKVSSPALESYLRREEKSLWRFAEEQGAVRVAWSCEKGEDPFADIDTQADVQAAEQRLAKSRL